MYDDYVPFTIHTTFTAYPVAVNNLTIPDKSFTPFNTPYA